MMIRTRIRTTRARASAHAGFSMMEVLVAIGIFALGFVAIAAIFPSAAVMQRGTADDVQSRHLERSAKALMQTTWPSDAELSSFYHASDPNESRVMPFPASYLNGSSAIWNLDARSYPAFITDPFLRDYYWVPLVRDANGDATNPDFRIYVFVIDRQSGNYVRDGGTWANAADGQADIDGDTQDEWLVPGVRRIKVIADPENNYFEFDDPDVTSNNPSGGNSRVLRENDWLLHERNGQIYRVTKADNNGVTVNSRIILGSDTGDQYIWYAHPGRDTTEDDAVDDYRHHPAKRLFTVSE